MLPITKHFPLTISSDPKPQLYTQWEQWQHSPTQPVSVQQRREELQKVVFRWRLRRAQWSPLMWILKTSLGLETYTERASWKPNVEALLRLPTCRRNKKKLYLFDILSVSVFVSLPFEERYHQLSQEVYLRGQTENRALSICIRKRTLLRRRHDVLHCVWTSPLLQLFWVRLQVDKYT